MTFATFFICMNKKQELIFIKVADKYIPQKLYLVSVEVSEMHFKKAQPFFL